MINDLGSGGAQRVVTNIANGWAREGRIVCVVTFASPDKDFFVLDSEVQRRVIERGKIAKSILGKIFHNVFLILELRSVLHVLRSPVLVSFILPMNILAILAGIGLKTRNVVSERNDPKLQFLGWRWTILRWIFYRFADLVTANTHGALERMRGYVPEHKLTYLPNPILIQESAHSSIIKNNSKRMILTVGRLYPHKGHSVLLEAFGRLSLRIPGWRLSIVGKGPQKESLVMQARKFLISDQIDWHGEIDDPSFLYTQADIFVLPSRYEGMPNALLEAMSFGVPVIVTDASPGPLENVEDNLTGLVVPVDDPDALAVALSRLISDCNLRRRLGEAARARVSGFSLKKVLTVWQRVLNMPESEGVKSRIDVEVMGKSE